MTNDTAILPWAVVLSALAAFFAWRAWTAGDVRAAVRRTGWALVPWALWLVGALRLAVRVADAVADWAVGFVFRPSVWVGIGLAVVAVLMIVWGSRGKDKQTKGDAAPTLDATGSRPAVAGSGKPGATSKGAGRTKGSGRAKDSDDDLGEIEDILRRHGIE